MKANELRIGNWVNYKGTPISVTMLGEFGMQSKLEYATINAKFSTPDLSGIPITPEMLEKVGFVENYNSDFTHRYEHSQSVEFDYKFNIAELTKGIWWRGNFIKCDYLHQLQNLYYCLTGQELNIEL